MKEEKKGKKKQERIENTSLTYTYLNYNVELQLRKHKSNVKQLRMDVYYDIVCADLICHTSCCNSTLSPSYDVYKNQLIRIEWWWSETGSRNIYIVCSLWDN